MKAMSITRDVNLGTLIPLFIWLLGATIAAVLWAGHQNAETEAIRDWQVRQDTRIENLEGTQQEILGQNARMEALLEVILEENRQQGRIILQELRGRSYDPRD